MVCLWMALTSMVYFASLVLGLPLLVPVFTALLLSMLGVMGARLLSKDYEHNGISWLSLLIWLGGIVLVVNRTYYLQEKYGHWDAWWFWNVRANYLSSLHYWPKAFWGHTYGTPFTLPVAHADYPPFLPSIIGFIWRILGSQHPLVPYGVSILVSLLVPTLIFLELQSRNILVAAAALTFFVTQDHFLLLGVGQIADGWIGLFLLLAVISFEHYRTSNQRHHLTLTGISLGCCLWVKNEGVLILFVSIAFYLLFLLKSSRWKSFLAGLLIPLAAWIGFKTGIAPDNDLIQAQQGNLWSKVVDISRYKLIWAILKENVQLFYSLIPYLLGVLIVTSALLRRWPNRLFYLILTIFIGYIFVYILSPHDLEWHAKTSMDRLIYQLLPAFIFIIALHLCKEPFSSGSQKPVHKK